MADELVDVPGFWVIRAMRDSEGVAPHESFDRGAVRLIVMHTGSPKTTAHRVLGKSRLKKFRYEHQKVDKNLFFRRLKTKRTL